MTALPLIIKELSSSGELIRTITCEPGFVTVFRSHHYAELRPYQRILAGVGGAEHLSIFVGENPYAAHEHPLIGFGEQFKPADGTVKNYLITAGVPEDGVLSLLSGYNIERTLDTLCSQLTPSDARIVRLSALLYSKPPVAVLNDPFEPIPSQLRERFAELIVAYARTTPAVVLVPSLSYRPEAWIDNEFIMRTQVGETRQKTIGFASVPSDVRSALQQVRSEFNQIQDKPARTAAAITGLTATSLEATIAEGTGSERPQSSNTKPASLTRPIEGIIPLAGSLVLVAAVSALGYYLFRHQQQEVVDRSMIIETASLSTEATQEPTPSQPLTPEASEAPTPPPTPVPDTTHLGTYPEFVKVSILHAFEGTSTLSAPAESQPGVKPALIEAERDQNSPSDFLQMLQGASAQNQNAQDTNHQESSYQPQEEQPQSTSEEDMSWEQRREMMRQRFLESIREASQE
jgi:hypothetical protein